MYFTYVFLESRAMLKRTKACLLFIALILPLAAGAAGLGRLTVTSAPGQPFKAEIDLVAVKKEEKLSLSARLAPQETFRQANVDYLPLLSTFKTTVETRSDGLPYVKIVSPQAVAEPLLNMLVELNWPSGRLLREYTVVLTQPENDAHPPAKPLIQANSPGSVKGDPATEKTHEKNHSSIKHGEKTPVVAESAPQAFKTPGVYGPVKQGDTLGGIANNIPLPTGTSFNQMLVALHRANPDAFIDNNMHQLKAGPVLKIPDSGEIAEVSPAEANKEIQVQTVDWNQRRLPSAVAVAEELKQTVTGKIDRTVEADGIAAREPATEVLKLSKGAEPWNAANDASNMGSNPGEKKSEQPGTQDRLHAMEEDVTAKSRALREANERIALLEKNIKELQQLLELKNLALAEMQKRAEGRPGAATASVPPATVSLQSAPGPEAPVAAQPPAQPVSRSISPQISQLPSSGIEANEPEQVAANQATADEAAETVEIAKSVQPAKLTHEQASGVDTGTGTRTRGKDTIIDDLVANFEYLGGALVLLITGIVGVSMVRGPKSSSLFDSDEDAVSSSVPYSQPRDSAQGTLVSPGADTAGLAHEVAPASFTERDVAGTGLNTGGTRSAEQMKEEFEKRDTHWHEIVNKVDLARAYREMGDEDAARQILQEVIDEGDARQQESARLMLANL